MDAVTLALAKNYTNSQRLANIESHNVTCNFKEESEISVPFLIYTYRWFSNKMPTPTELKAASVGLWFGIDAERYGENFVFDGTMPSSSGMYSTFWKTKNMEIIIGVLVAYEAGQHTVTYDGQDYTVEAPRAGLYVMMPDEALESDIFKNSEYFNVEVAWESVKTIEPKFLPGVCLPVVEITSAEYPSADDTGMVPVVKLSAEESAQFETAANGGLPVVVKFVVANPFAATIKQHFAMAGYLAIIPETPEMPTSVAVQCWDFMTNTLYIFAKSTDGSGWEMGG